VRVVRLASASNPLSDTRVQLQKLRSVRAVRLASASNPLSDTGTITEVKVGEGSEASQREQSVV
jgi:hypothetical protein